MAILTTCFCSLTLKAQTDSDIERQRDSIVKLIEKESNLGKLAMLYNQLAYKHLGRNIYESNSGGMNNLFD